MPTSCDDILISTDFSAEAVGGANFATAIIRSGDGGAIAHRNVNREDYVSQYEIEFGNLTAAKQENLRSFTVLRQGMARAFLFLAPDASRLSQEHVGVLDPGSGNVDYLPATSGTQTVFYAIKNYSDPFNAYNRRLCKLSPYAELKLEIFNPANNGVLAGIADFPPDVFTGLYYDAVVESKTLVIGMFDTAARSVTVNFRQGKFTVTPVLPAGLEVKLTATYLLPVTFDDDWMKFSIDETTTGSFKIQVTEVLPIELGIV